MIRTENLTKRYKTADVETTALDDVNLTIDQGDFVAIMGPSGCGKSTLLNVLGLLDNPCEGRYEFMNRDVSGATERERALLRKHHVGFIFQSFNLIDELTVFENIELPLIYQGMSSLNRKKKRLARLWSGWKLPIGPDISRISFLAVNSSVWLSAGLLWGIKS